MKLKIDATFEIDTRTGRMTILATRPTPDAGCVGQPRNNMEIPPEPVPFLALTGADLPTAGALLSYILAGNLEKRNAELRGVDLYVVEAEAEAKHPAC